MHSIKFKLLYTLKGFNEMKFLRKNILSIILAFSSLYLILALIYNTFVPTTVVVVLGAISFLVLTVGVSKFSKTLKITVALLFIISSSFLFYTQYSAERVINYTETEKNIITFVVVKDSELMTIEDTKGATFGSSQTMDELTETFLVDQLNSKIGDYTWESVTDDQSNMELLYNGKIDILVLDNSMRDYLKEMDPDFESKTRIIWTVEKSTIKEVIVKEVDISKKPFTVLISGIDIAGSINLRSRSDVNILMVVNPGTNKILTISIPRDTYTQLGCKTGDYDKLTHSGIYGVNCTVKTIENLLDIDINYYVRVNFTSLTKLVDVIGNINVYSKYSFTTEDGSHFVSGMNSLNSAEALTFARARHQFESGDIQRGLNQQEVIKGIIGKLLSPSTFTKIEGIIKAVGKSIDTNFTTDDLSKLIKKQIDNNIAWDITTSNLSGVGAMKPTYSMGSRLLYVMIPNPDSLIQVKQNIKAFMVVSN